MFLVTFPASECHCLWLVCTDLHCLVNRNTCERLAHGHCKTVGRTCKLYIISQWTIATLCYIFYIFPPHHMQWVHQTEMTSEPVQKKVSDLAISRMLLLRCKHTQFTQYISQEINTLTTITAVLNSHLDDRFLEQLYATTLSDALIIESVLITL